MNYLIGYFSRRRVFHIIAYRENIEEVKAYLKTHNNNRLIVYAAQQDEQADGATAPDHKHDFKNSLYCSVCGVAEF